jgi:hypothetical protein
MNTNTKPELIVIDTWASAPTEIIPPTQSELLIEREREFAALRQMAMTSVNRVRASEYERKWSLFNGMIEKIIYHLDSLDAPSSEGGLESRMRLLEQAIKLYGQIGFKMAPTEEPVEKKSTGDVSVNFMIATSSVRR